jgi:hypothetical protein
MQSIKDYSQELEGKSQRSVSKQSVWTRPIVIHVMPQLRRKVSHQAFYLTITVWILAISLVATYFFIK